MSKFIVFLFCLTLVYCATVHKREADEDQEASSTEGDNKREESEQPEEENTKDLVEEKSGENKEKAEVENRDEKKDSDKSDNTQQQNIYYLVPLATELLYPVETFDMPIVYYVK